MSCDFIKNSQKKNTCYKNHNNLTTKQTGNQAVSLRSFPLFRSAVPVGRRQKKPPSIPQALQQHSKIIALKKSRYFLAPFSFLIFTRSLPAFGRASASIIPLHFVSFNRSLSAPLHSAASSLFLFTTFQPYYVYRPPCFQRLLFRPAIGVGSVSTLP